MSQLKDDVKHSVVAVSACRSFIIMDLVVIGYNCFSSILEQTVMVISEYIYTSIYAGVAEWLACLLRQQV